jgi:hypothetical protein
MPCFDTLCGHLCIKYYQKMKYTCLKKSLHRKSIILIRIYSDLNNDLNNDLIKIFYDKRKFIEPRNLQFYLQLKKQPVLSINT